MERIENRMGTINPIIIRDLYKSYGDVEAVKGVTLELQPGEIFGLIGPDGAGKTSIIRILVSLLNPDKGVVLFKGKEVKSNPAFVRSSIGYMPQRFSLYQDLTVQENLAFFGDLFKVSGTDQEKRLDELYAFSKLGPFKNRRAGALSGGMKQKLALSCMLIHNPDVIVLDEPTFGVDPVSRSEFWDILKNLSDDGTTILVTTAYMDEATLCDRTALIYEGNILAVDTPDDMVNSFTDPLYLIRTADPQTLFNAMQIEDQLNSCELFGDGVHYTDINQSGIIGLNKRIAELGLSFEEIVEIKPQLEDVFLGLINEAGRV